MSHSTRCRSERRVQDQLENSPRLYLPTLLPSATLLSENPAREGEGNIDLPILAEPIFVSRPSGTSGRSPTSDFASTESAESNEQPHPLLLDGSLTLSVWRLFGHRLEAMEFRKKLRSYCWPETTRTHPQHTSQPGLVGIAGAWDGTWIPWEAIK